MDPYPIRRTACARIPTNEGTYQLCHYVDATDGKEHLALVMGDVEGKRDVLVRVHSECFTGDVLGSQRCDCGEQLHLAMRLVAGAGAGVILYLRQEGRGIGLADKLRAYNLQDQGYDTVDANLMLGHQADEREYSAAAAMLVDLGVASVHLMTNNPAKIEHLTRLGIVVNGRIPLVSTVTADNAAYLATKVQRMQHLLTLPNGNHPPAQPSTAASVIRQDSLVSAAQRIDALRRRADDHFALTGRPFVTLSYAQSIDGCIGSVAGGPLAISGPAALRLTHALRAQHDAILVGIGTVLADNPRLTVRFVDGPSPQPVIVDTHARLPLDAALWQHPKSPWIATSRADSESIQVLTHRGGRVLSVPADGSGRVDLAELMQLLGAQGIRSIMVEGGAQIIGTMLAARLAHHLIVTIAPRFVGGLNLPIQSPITSITNPVYTLWGEDLVLWGDLPAAEAQPAWRLHHPPAHADAL